ncbi:TPR-like protein [Coprinopsis marcescibilis]|uniref:TPR-like protein n=1 Tax=Coprinopsis marcescibilis TaxID=230819 RepID=A0A5C3KP74_COPMA|nr:TPR-like protein [Coprinopsis marcescibilis]
MRYRAVQESDYQLGPYAGPGPLEEFRAGACDGHCSTRLETKDEKPVGIGLEYNEGRRALVLYQHSTLTHNILVPNEFFPILTETIETFRQAAEKDSSNESKLSDVLNNYAVWLCRLGRNDDALRIGHEAVAARRHLVSAHSKSYEAHLASSLFNLARYFALLQRTDESISPLLEALAILRRQSDPAYQSLIADALHHYALYLHLLCKYEQALEPAHEAVAMWFRLAEQDQADSEYRLAWSLYRLSKCYWSLKQYDDAISVVQQSIELQRHVINNSSDSLPFQGLLARSLFHCARCLSDRNRNWYALEPGLEAMCIYRSLVQVAEAPEEYTRSYADSISRLAQDLSYCHRQPAIQLLERLLIYKSRRLSTKDPKTYEPTLGDCLFRQALSFSIFGYYSSAVEVLEQTIPLRRRCAKNDPTSYEPALAETLHQYALDLSRMGRSEDAIEPETEAVEIYRRLAEVDAPTYEVDLGWAYNNLSCYLSACNRHPEAIPYAESTCEIRRQISRRKPQDQLSHASLREAMENYAIYLSNVGRYKEAIELDKEGVDICRTLTAMNPDRFEPSLANTLYTLAFDLNCDDRDEEAVVPVKESIDIRRRLAAKDYYGYIEPLADALNQYAWSLTHCRGRVHESLEPAEECVSIQRKLLEEFPPTADRIRNLANSLDTAAHSLSLLERCEEALPLIEEAIGLYPQMISGGNVEAFDHVGSALHQTYGKVLRKMGRDADALGPLREAVKIYRRLVDASHSGRYDARLEECVGLLEGLAN